MCEIIDLGVVETATYYLFIYFIYISWKGWNSTKYNVYITNTTWQWMKVWTKGDRREIIVYS